MAAQPKLTLATAPGGVPIGGGGGTPATFTGGFGPVNGLGVGTPGAGISVTTTGVTGGVLYTTPYNLVVSGTPVILPVVVRAYISANFTHPTVLQVESCPVQGACSVASGFAVMPTASAAEIDVVSGVLTGTSSASLGLFVSNVNGGAAFTGNDTAEITFHTYTNLGPLGLFLSDTTILKLNTPVVTVQTAIRLQLATAPGGATISAGSGYALAAGNVNGLGINPPSGFRVVTSGVSGGVIYSTPYLINPTFSGFTTLTGSVKVYVSVNFAHPSTVQLRDSPDNLVFSAISTNVGSQTNIASASPTLTLTRYLGIFVSSANGAGTFRGADSAQLTYTLTVP